MKSTLTFPNIRHEERNYTVKADIELTTEKGKDKRSWIDLQPIEEYEELHISFSIYHNGTLEYAGQCQDRVDEIAGSNKQLRFLLEMQEKYHLNGMCAGTKKQTDYLRNVPAELSYEKKLVALEKVGLAEDRGYKYGTGWLCKVIPQEDLDAILQFIRGKLFSELEQNEEDDVSYDEIFTCIENLDEDRKIELWNNWKYENGYDDYIHINDEDFFETFFKDAMEAVRAVSFGHYNYNDDYVVFNGYGNLDSFSFLSESNSPYSDEELADIIDDNKDVFGELLDEIREER
ncbi:MAG: hypothetical protein J6P44_02355 [Bacteroidales bacterium]|nr:hypothetical protein [Bacteroidales bacterium]